jgi:hypothetical protein
MAGPNRPADPGRDDIGQGTRFFRSFNPSLWITSAVVRARVTGRAARQGVLTWGDAVVPAADCQRGRCPTGGPLCRGAAVRSSCRRWPRRPGGRTAASRSVPERASQVPGGGASPRPAGRARASQSVRPVGPSSPSCDVNLVHEQGSPWGRQVRWPGNKRPAPDRPKGARRPLVGVLRPPSRSSTRAGVAVSPQPPLDLVDLLQAVQRPAAIVAALPLQQPAVRGRGVSGGRRARPRRAAGARGAA